MKKRMLSGVQSTGFLHLGNYFGALKNWVELQKTHEVFACIVDLHALTVAPDPKKLMADTLSIAKWLIAFGLDPKKSVLFVQSDVGGYHTELAWIFSTLTKIAELERMTQFKDKAAQHRNNLNAGLLMYPVLQAADIALYNADVVPVGEDQKQHLELARTIITTAKKRAKKLVVPESLIPKVGARIMGLDDPNKKMSKSAPTPNNYLSFLDDEKTLRTKIQRAVTDSGSEIRMSDNKPAISNLLTIDHLVAGRSVKELESDYKGMGYGQFKQQLANHVVEFILPIQKRFHAISNHEIEKILSHGKTRAEAVASETLSHVKFSFGLRF